LLQSDEFGGQLDRASFLAEALKPLVAQYPDPAARAAAVRELIVKNVKYDGTNRYSASGPLKKSYELHRGTAADVNLLLIAAMRQVGLAAQPVLLSTRTHGRIDTNFPQLQQFNYVIGMLPLAGDQELLLDATEPLLPCGTLPTRCLNQTGRLVTKGTEGRWVSLTPKQMHNHFQQVTLTVDEQGNLSGKVHEEHAGYAGVAAREKHVTELAGRHTSWEMPSYKFSQVAQVDQPLSLNYELRQPASTPGAAREIYLNPMTLFGESSNPFQHAQRLYPVDFGAPVQEVLMVTITLPAGYTAELPKSAVVEMPDKGGRYVFTAVNATPSTVQLTSRLSLSKPIYGAQEYALLREFYRMALAKQAEALVLKKAGS
jgi:hypothetical protein